MKVINKFLILLMLAVPFVGFAGCSDDDDDNDSAEGKAAAITGDYKGGENNLKLWNTLPVASNVTIKIAEGADDSHVKFPINLEFAVSMGATAGPTVKVVGECVNGITYANSKYTINSATGSAFTVTITQPGGEPQSIPNLSVAIDGTVEGSTATLKIVVPLNAGLLAAFADNAALAAVISQLTPDANGNVPVTVNFTGTKQ